MGTRPATGVSVLCALWLLACAAPPPAGPARVAEPRATLVPVLYPKGGCQTGWLQVQVYDASIGRWRPHPEHPRVRTGTCHREPSQDLLTDLRVRCIDPSGRRPASSWVQGTDLRGGAGACPTSDVGAPRGRQ